MLDSNPSLHAPNALEPTPGAGAENRSSPETPQSRLLAAASGGDLDAIARVLSEPAARLDLDHPLRLAAKHRHPDAVQLLIARGASPTRAFSPNHTPARCGKREQLVRFLASCGIEAEFVLALPRPRGPRPSRHGRSRRTGRSGERGADRPRAREAAAKREAWTARRDALRVHKVLKHYEGLLAEILASVPADGECRPGLERTVRATLVEHRITDRRQRLSKAIVRKLYDDGYVRDPAAAGRCSLTSVGLRLRSRVREPAEAAAVHQGA